jgi:hypothetical protein
MRPTLIDREALERAVELVRAESDAQRERIDDRLAAGESWEQIAKSCAYSLQMDSLRLQPWESPPIYADAHEAVELVARLQNAGLSRYEPRPLQALERAERRFTRAGKPAPTSDDEARLTNIGKTAPTEGRLTNTSKRRRPLSRARLRGDAMELPSNMLAFDDDELSVVMTFAQPLAPRDRDAFLRAVCFELSKHGERGPGLIHRVVCETQRQFFDAPIFHSASRWSR